MIAYAILIYYNAVKYEHAFFKKKWLYSNKKFL